MSQIPSAISSVAQTALTQKEQAVRQDAVRAGGELAADRQGRLRTEHRESVEDMVEATGLKVDPDSGHEGEARRRKRFSLMHKAPAPPVAGQPPPADDAETRAHAAALLAEPGHPDGPTPAPCIIDVKA